MSCIANLLTNCDHKDDSVCSVTATANDCNNRNNNNSNNRNSNNNIENVCFECKLIPVLLYILRVAILVQ